MNIRFTYALKRTLLYASSLALFACGDCGASTNNNNPPADMTPTCTPACADGQSCVDGTCVDEGTASGLVVTAPGARSCEILLEEQASKVLGATYTDGVQGAWRKKAPNVALAISQTSDADLPSSVATLRLEGEMSGVTIKSTKCFDASGAEIQGASAAIQ